MKIREIASGLQFPEGPVAMDDGSVILVEIARQTTTRITPDGKHHLVAKHTGGPNGAAIGPDGHLYITNNGGFKWVTDPAHGLRPTHQADDYSGGRIERVNIATGKIERLYEKSGDHALRGPNDLVFDSTGGFWFTDLGKARAGELDHGGVFYARADGSSIRTISHPFMTANGIGISPDEKTVYVAETVAARLWAFDVDTPGTIKRHGFPSPNGGRLLGGGNPAIGFQRYDSLCVDAEGNVLVATLVTGGITVISPDGKNVERVAIPGDLYVTNCCFGGKDMRTLYVTLSGHGKLIAIDDWPTKGLRLAYNA